MGENFVVILLSSDVRKSKDSSLVHIFPDHQHFIQGIVFTPWYLFLDRQWWGNWLHYWVNYIFSVRNKRGRFNRNHSAHFYLIYLMIMES